MKRLFISLEKVLKNDLTQLVLNWKKIINDQNLHFRCLYEKESCLLISAPAAYSTVAFYKREEIKKRINDYFGYLMIKKVVVIFN